MKYKTYSIEEVNEKIASNAKKIILDTDSQYREQLFNLANKILEKKETNMVLIAGPSCAGKTTTARLIKEILEKKGRHVITISMDDFFIDRAKTPVLPSGVKDFDSPRAIDTDLMKQAFGKLFKDGKAIFPEYDFITGVNNHEAKEIEMKYNSLIIFEGLHVLNPKFVENVVTTNYFKIYVNAQSYFKYDKEVLNSKDIRLFRRIVRDIARRQYSVKHTLENWDTVCEAEDKYITKYKNNADVIVDTTHEYELGVLREAYEKMVLNKQAKYSQLPFGDIIKKVNLVSKCLLPDTTLMWEFVDPPTSLELDEYFCTPPKKEN